MANLTISVDAEVLKRARIQALHRGTSVNALVREYLDAFTGGGRQRAKGLRSLLRQSREASSRRGGRRWNRDELHER